LDLVCLAEAGQQLRAIRQPNISTNSNIANPNPTNTVKETTTGVNAEILKKIEDQQKEDQRLAEEKLKNAGKSSSNSNSAAPKTASKGNQQTF
jgi:hypothetical protein